MDTEVKPKLNLALRIKQLRELRTKIKAIEEEFEKEMKPYKEKERLLYSVLYKYLLERGVKTINTQEGSITAVEKFTYPIEDQVAFSRHVIGTEAWEMLVWRANDTVVKDYVKENDGLLPPGLRMNDHSYMRVNAPTKKTLIVKKTELNIEETEE